MLELTVRAMRHSTAEAGAKLFEEAKGYDAVILEAAHLPAEHYKLLIKEHKKVMDGRQQAIEGLMVQYSNMARVQNTPFIAAFAHKLVLSRTPVGFLEVHPAPKITMEKIAAIYGRYNDAGREFGNGQLRNLIRAAEEHVTGLVKSDIEREEAMAHNLPNLEAELKGNYYDLKKVKRLRVLYVLGASHNWAERAKALENENIKVNEIRDNAIEDIPTHMHAAEQVLSGRKTLDEVRGDKKTLLLIGLESYIGNRFHDKGSVPPIEGFGKLRDSTTVEELEELTGQMATDKASIDRFLTQKGVAHFIPN